MSNEEKIKKRGKNFTAEEELVLMLLVEERKSVLESRKSDAATWKQKEQAWEEIGERFFEKTGMHREWKTLRDKFLHTKRKSKMDISGEKNNTKVSMLNDSSRGLSNAFDSDASNVHNDLSYAGDGDLLGAATDEQDDLNLSAHEEDIATSSSVFASWNQSTRHWPKSRKRRLEDETIKLVRLQQDFFRCKNQRAQEKHDQEMLKEKLKLDQEMQEGKLRVEMMELEILEKRAKLDMKW